MDVRLDEHTALVTGAARNLGRAIAIEMGASGALVLCAYQSGRDAAQETAEQIIAAGGRAEILALDVADPDSVTAAVATAARRGHLIDILVNNAAVRPRSRIADVTVAEWDFVLNTNLRGPFLLSQAVIPRMADQKWGRIINISGVDAYRGNPQRAHNVAAKMGIIGLSRSIANEVGRWGITVNTLVPGTMNTPRYHAEWEGDPAVDSALRQERLQHIPVARLGEPEEIAAAAVYLASERAAYVTGQELLVTGGMHPAVRQPSLEY